MTKPKSKSTLDTAAADLRGIILSGEEGVFLGSEEELQARLGVARATLRQVARLLEREGLLRVKRGINGGYFSSRPDLNMIEESVSTYLQALKVDAADLTSVASALWVEAIRKAAGLHNEETKAMCEHYRKKVAKLPDAAGFDDMMKLERESRAAIFKLINAPYIELIFRMNVAFSRRMMTTSPAERDATEEHRQFIQAWRNAKLLELNTVADGEPELAALAARHVRSLLQRRLWKD